jgi:malonate-semialdehyde dehydrogenase (acetylating)/methylmalonate-semialdehyde dehydrogenase
VPLPFFSFTGWRGSFHGDLHAYGKQAVRFYTETKTITARWFDDSIPGAGGPNMSINLK